MWTPAEVLDNRAWLRRSWPFPHVVSQNVFKAEFYDELTAQVREILDRGLSETPAKGQFSRSIPGYDAYGFGLDQPSSGPLSLFLAPAWRDMMCGLFHVGVTPYVFAGGHHHAPGSRNGFVHNDFNPVWFPRGAEEGIRTPQHALCSYRTGSGPLEDSEKIEVVRGAVMIFFLLNDGWRPGDGGETGLYTTGQSCVSEPAARCPPENNSLIAFECTPQSFHAFLTNTRLPRTSIIMWVHRPLPEAAAKFGEEHLERWVL